MDSNGLKEAWQEGKSCLRKHGKVWGGLVGPSSNMRLTHSQGGEEQSEAGHATDPGIQSRQQASSPEGVERFEGRGRCSWLCF